LLTHGKGYISFESKDEKTYLKDLYQENPVKILFPKKLSNEIITAAFVTTSGGIVGGDKLDIIVKTCKKSEVQLYQQAAEKVYKNHKKPSIINISLTSEEGSWLEWLPQETILFENSNYIKKNSLHVNTNGRLMVGEMLFLGRHAMGEINTKGTIREIWEIFFDDRLIWLDNFYIDDMDYIVKHPAGLNGANAFASIVYTSANVLNYIDEARKIIKEFKNIRIGITVIDNVFICKMLSCDQYLLRKYYGIIWAKFRKLFGNYQATLPRLWYV
tara:strand:- start:4446 stop:5261 length:816 start_codon:yes stop_codon:yes gene_type:complete